MAYTEQQLRSLGLIETSPGVFEKPSVKKIVVKKKKSVMVDGLAWIPYVNPNMFRDPNIHRIEMKPISVNRVWQGRRFKTKEYLAYEEATISILPNIIIPEPPYRINFEFGLSSRAGDWDNPVKPIQDILQKKYKFDDKEIYEAFVRKVIVPKRQEYFSFELIHIDL